jgi:hypothetical protein
MGVHRDTESTYVFNNNLFLHMRYRGEGQAFAIFYTPATGNMLRDFVFDGGQGNFADRRRAAPDDR